VSESEIIELILLSVGETAQTVMNLTAVVFAYVLTAYFVGSQLPRVWAIGISLCYTLFLTPMIVGCITSVSVATSLVSAYLSNFPGGVVADDYAVYGKSPLLILSLVLIPVAVGWLGSLLYMHNYIRKEGAT